MTETPTQNGKANDPLPGYPPLPGPHPKVTEPPKVAVDPEAMFAMCSEVVRRLPYWIEDALNNTCHMARFQGPDGSGLAIATFPLEHAEAVDALLKQGRPCHSREVVRADTGEVVGASEWTEPAVTDATPKPRHLLTPKEVGPLALELVSRAVSGVVEANPSLHTPWMELGIDARAASLKDQAVDIGARLFNRFGSEA